MEVMVAVRSDTLLRAPRVRECRIFDTGPEGPELEDKQK
jgi:hypothetical protein